MNIPRMRKGICHVAYGVKMLLDEDWISFGLELNQAVNVPFVYFSFSLRFQTFTSMTGFRAHLKSRQRAGEISAEDSSRATPVEVKVLDGYLTVADTRKPSGSSSRKGRCWPRLFARGKWCGVVWCKVPCNSCRLTFFALHSQIFPDYIRTCGQQAERAPDGLQATQNRYMWYLGRNQRLR